MKKRGTLESTRVKTQVARIDVLKNLPPNPFFPTSSICKFVKHTD